MSFPIFPHFRKLVPEDRAEYVVYFERVEPYSDFSFNNLIIWLDLYGDLEISRINSCIVLRFTHPFEPDRRTAYTLLGNRDCLHAINEIFAYQSQHQLPVELAMVPECVVSNILHNHNLPQDLVIHASNDHRDYLFDIADVLALQGQTLLNLRRNLHLFERQHAAQDVTIEVSSLADHTTQTRILQALDTWQEDPDFIKNDPQLDEAKALRRHFQYHSACPAECRCFFIDGKIFGFSIVHRPPQRGWAIFNHLKSSRSVPFGYDYIYHETLKQLYREDVSMINFEQDLGIPGLRTHKKQLGRAEFLYRYNISRF